MTVIAIRDGVVAADSAVSFNGFEISYGAVDKIVKINGWIVGASGSLTQCRCFFRWMRGSKIKVDWPGIHGIALRPDGRIFEFSYGPEPIEMRMPYGVAIGSGCNTAIAAMMAGADAVRAVEITVDLDQACGGPIQIIEQ